VYKRQARGQAAGTAAKLAIDGGCAVQQVDTGALVADLSAQGVHGLGNAELVAA